MGRYRSRLKIIRDILLVVSTNGGSNKTHILHGANLAYKVLERYLEELLNSGLLKYDEGSRYWLTDKGERFLKLYDDYDRSRRDLEEQIENLQKEKRLLNKIIT